MKEIELEIQIKLEEISKKLKRTSLNRIDILNISPLVYNYTTDYIGFQNNSQKFGHKEKVSISINDKIEIIFTDIIDNCWAHYTPEKLLFNDVENVILFLENRYYGNDWLIVKKRKKRYFTNL